MKQEVKNKMKVYCERKLTEEGEGRGCKSKGRRKRKRACDVTKIGKYKNTSNKKKRKKRMRSISRK